MLTKSKTDRDEPSRVIPKTDKEAPTRKKLRKDSDEPRWVKSSTDKDAPSRRIP
jgi:hypothetical protein